MQILLELNTHNIRALISISNALKYSLFQWRRYQHVCDTSKEADNNLGERIVYLDFLLRENSIL